MAIEGTLQEMDLATVLQMVSQRGSAPACILLQRGKERAVLFVEGHMVSHAEMAVQTAVGLQTHTGAEVFYELLKWHTGTFSVKREINPPQRSINQSWDFLLMEGLRRMDETGQAHHELDEADEDPESVLGMLSTLSPADADAIRELITVQKETEAMNKRQQINTILNELIQNSTDFVGVAVIDKDGELLTSVFRDEVDGQQIALASANLIALASQTAQQLNHGSLKLTLVQAEMGNFIAVRANETVSLIGLMGAEVNLGLAFVKCTKATEAIALFL